MKPIYKLVRQPSFRPGHAIISEKDYDRKKEKIVLMYPHICKACGKLFESEEKDDSCCSIECIEKELSNVENSGYVNQEVKQEGLQSDNREA